jgi:hypothetical protein
MAQINSYPLGTPKSIDLLIGTEMPDPEGPVMNPASKSYTIGSIVSLAGELIPASNSYGLYAQTELGNPITFADGETSLVGVGVGTLLVPANSFKVGDSFVVKMCGPVSCGNNIGLDIRIRSNGIIILETPVFELATCTDRTYDLILDFTVASIGGAGTAQLFANGSFTYNKNSSSAFEGVNFRQISETTFDTTIANELDITAEWLEDSPTNQIASQNFTLIKIY